MPKHPSTGYRRMRNGRQSLHGQLYLLTTVTHNRTPYFLDTGLARLTARTLSEKELWLPSRCLCWVLMPDHWHGLIELGESATLAKTVQRIKGVTSRLVGKQFNIDSPLWARGFHDHALRKVESAETVARYIIANPLRAGLVTDVMDYPYWNAEFIDGPLFL